MIRIIRRLLARRDAHTKAVRAYHGAGKGERRDAWLPLECGL